MSGGVITSGVPAPLRKINNSRTCALFRVNGVPIGSFEMDYKGRLCLSSLPEALGATKRFETSYNSKAVIGDFKNIGC